MAKFVEIPRKPREVEAVRFTGVVNGVPTTAETGWPTWFVAAFAQGVLHMVGDDVFLREELVSPGEWLVRDETLESLHIYQEGHFAANFRPKRKTPVARKPRAVKTPVAKAAK